jgi:GNAT superfamily N-acetyltransferase
MTLPQSLSLIIRDGIADDIAACLALDHSYQTDHVWQLQILSEENQRWQLELRRERLPRMLTELFAANGERVRSALPSDQCFLVAANRVAYAAHTPASFDETSDALDEETVPAMPSVTATQDEVIGYLTLWRDGAYRMGWIRDLVIARPYRRHQLGSRLLNVARTWARDHKLTRLMLAIPSKNDPAITLALRNGFTFCGYNDRYFPNQDIAMFFGQAIR